MNNVIQFSFAEWLAEEERQMSEAVAARIRTPLQDMGKEDAVLMMMDTGDIIELPAWKSSGQEEYGQIMDIRGNKIVYKNLISGEISQEPARHFIEKPDEEISHKYQQQMTAMGANKMWIRLTKSRMGKEQRRQTTAQANRQQQDDEMTAHANRGEDMERRLKDMFRKGSVDAPEMDPLQGMLGGSDDDEPKTLTPAPLARHFKRARTGDDSPVLHPAMSRLLSKVG